MNTSRGPSGFLESRTTIAPSTKATSTELSVRAPERVLLRQTASLRSDARALGLNVQNDSLTMLATSAVDSSGGRATSCSDSNTAS